MTEAEKPIGDPNKLVNKIIDVVNEFSIQYKTTHAASISALECAKTNIIISIAVEKAKEAASEIIGGLKEE